MECFNCSDRSVTVHISSSDGVRLSHLHCTGKSIIVRCMLSSIAG